MTKTIEKLFTGAVLEGWRAVNNFGKRCTTRVNIDPDTRGHAGVGE